jgi:hypothetical protein
MVVISREVKNEALPGCTRLVTAPDFIGFSTAQAYTDLPSTPI